MEKSQQNDKSQWTKTDTQENGSKNINIGCRSNTIISPKRSRLLCMNFNQCFFLIEASSVHFQINRLNWVFSKHRRFPLLSLSFQSQIDCIHSFDLNANSHLVSCAQRVPTVLWIDYANWPITWPAIYMNTNRFRWTLLIHTKTRNFNSCSKGWDDSYSLSFF